jgi:hypothetical protein
LSAATGRTPPKTLITYSHSGLSVSAQVAPLLGVLTTKWRNRTTKKVTTFLPGELVEALGVAAREDGVPLSRLVAGMAGRESGRIGSSTDRDWQAEHGALAWKGFAAARAEMAAADAEVMSPTPSF